MPTTLAAPAPPPVVEPSPAVVPDPSRILLQGLSWATYRRILDETGDNRRTRLAFLQGDLELMSPGPMHEEDSRGVNRLVEVVCVEAHIPFKAYGSTTWTSEADGKGIEADECYYFRLDKIAAAAALSKRKVNDATRYPRPDLAIEIDIRRSNVDRPKIYAALGVPELWSYSDGALQIEALGPGGVYAGVEQSQFLPIATSDMLRWLIELESREDVGAWTRDFQAWVRAALAAPA